MINVWIILNASTGSDCVVFKQASGGPPPLILSTLGISFPLNASSHGKVDASEMAQMHATSCSIS